MGVHSINFDTTCVQYFYIDVRQKGLRCDAILYDTIWIVKDHVQPISFDFPLTTPSVLTIAAFLRVRLLHVVLKRARELLLLDEVLRRAADGREKREQLLNVQRPVTTFVVPSTAAAGTITSESQTRSL